MMLEKAIKLLKQYQGYEPMFPDGETLKHAFDLTDETVDTLLTALRPFSREQVEKVWRGGWIAVREAGCDPIGGYKCSRCKAEAVLDCNDEFVLDNFCPSCGAAMTDEAVQMVMERLEELNDGEETD